MIKQIAEYGPSILRKMMALLSVDNKLGPKKAFTFCPISVFNSFVRDDISKVSVIGTSDVKQLKAP